MRSREAQPPLRSAGGRPRYVRRRAAGYRSDYDILVIASSKKLAEPQYWDKATDRLLWDKGVSTPVGLIVHGAREVNNSLRTDKNSSSTSYTRASCSTKSTTGPDTPPSRWSVPMR